MVAERRELEAANARNEAARREFLDLEEKNKALKERKEQLESRKQALLRQVREIEGAIDGTVSLIEASDTAILEEQGQFVFVITGV